MHLKESLIRQIKHVLYINFNQICMLYVATPWGNSTKHTNTEHNVPLALEKAPISKAFFFWVISLILPKIQSSNKSNK